MQRTKPPFRADHVGSLLRSSALKDGPRQAREERDHRRAVEGGRGSRDRGDHQEAGGGRAEVHHRRRIPPRVLELRLPRQARRRRGLSRRAQDQVPGQAAEADDAARDRQARLVQPASDDRAFQVCRSAHQADGEDDDPVAVVAAFPLRPLGGAGGDLSGHGGFLPRSRPELPQGGARLRRRRLPLHPARRGEFHLSLRSGAAPAGHRARRRSFQPAAHLRAGHQRGDLRRARRHDHRHASVPRQLPVHLRRLRRLRAGGGDPVQRDQHPGLFHGVRLRPRRRLRAAALRAEEQDGGARPGHLEIRHAGIQGRAQAPHRSGVEIHLARSALPVAAMRLCLHRGRQYPGRGRAMGEAQDDRGTRR